jgi:hypothetical protein
MVHQVARGVGAGNDLGQLALLILTYSLFTTKETFKQKRGEEKRNEHQQIRRKADTHHHN